ncbi:Lsr2 family protein [Micromonospora sediminicola]|uniref:histone-like nucleoid-structuring protein Lsr2 n=1 Tax=Micromonospora sediminicola TaxID=946078 RepID=UPI0033CA6D25
MARRVVTVLTDDIDGGLAERTVEFSLEGVTYSIDLSDANTGALRKALDPFMRAGRRLGRTGSDGKRSTPAASRSQRDLSRAIREWAIRNGHTISARGRIPDAIIEKYHNR